MNKRYLSFLPIPALIIIIAVSNFPQKPSLFYYPVWLMPITNILCAAATGLCAAGRPSRYLLQFEKEARP